MAMTKREREKLNNQRANILETLENMVIDGTTQGDFMETENFLKRAQSIINNQRETLDAVTLSRKYKHVITRQANVKAKAAYIRESSHLIWT